jgi:hypothetical protein
MLKFIKIKVIRGEKKGKWSKLGQEEREDEI